MRCIPIFVGPRAAPWHANLLHVTRKINLEGPFLNHAHFSPNGVFSLLIFKRMPFLTGVAISRENLADRAMKHRVEIDVSSAVPK